MKEVLFDRAEFVLELCVQVLDDLGVAFHAGSFRWGSMAPGLCGRCGAGGQPWRKTRSGRSDCESLPLRSFTRSRSHYERFVFTIRSRSPVATAAHARRPS